MKEFKTQLVGPKRQVSGRWVRPISDWVLVDIFDNDDNFLGTFLAQEPSEYYMQLSPANTLDGTKNLLVIGDAMLDSETSRDAYHYGFLEVSQIEMPFPGISGYYGDKIGV